MLTTGLFSPKKNKKNQATTTNAPVSERKKLDTEIKATLISSILYHLILDQNIRSRMKLH